MADLNSLLELADKILFLENDEAVVTGTRKWKDNKRQFDTLKETFNRQKKEYITQLVDYRDQDTIPTDKFKSELASFRQGCDHSWFPVSDWVSDQVTPDLATEQARSPNSRQIRKYAPYGIGITLMVAYFATSILSGITIDQPLETRAGIVQRAAALEKVLRYDDLMQVHVRKGGWLKGILFWPIEPSDKEVAGAKDFAGVAYAGHQAAVERFGCQQIVTGSGSIPTKAELTYLENVANYVRRDSVVWKDPPIMIVLDAARVTCNSLQ